EARGLVCHGEDRAVGDAISRSEGEPATAGIPRKSKPRSQCVLSRHPGIREVVHFGGRSLRFVPKSHIDAEGRENTEIVLHECGVLPVSETAIEISDGDRK